MFLALAQININVINSTKKIDKTDYQLKSYTFLNGIKNKWSKRIFNNRIYYFIYDRPNMNKKRYNTRLLRGGRYKYVESENY